MKHLPWLAAGVTKEVWERARAALIDHVADLAWTARTVSKGRVEKLTDEPMQRLAEMSRGDRDATLYGLTLAERRKRDD